MIRIHRKVMIDRKRAVERAPMGGNGSQGFAEGIGGDANPIRATEPADDGDNCSHDVKESPRGITIHRCVVLIVYFLGYCKQEYEKEIAWIMSTNPESLPD